MKAITVNRSGRFAVGMLALVAVVGLSGCMREMTMEDFKAMKPQRPAELDRLNMLVGNWSGTGQAEFMGMKEPVQVTGKSNAQWQADGWYLVEQAEYKMGDME